MQKGFRGTRSHWLSVAGIGALALITSQPAWAGTWTFTRQLDGETVSNGETKSWVLPRPLGYPPQMPWNGTQTSTGAGTSGSELTASASTSGTVTIVCTWTPNPGDIVPMALRVPASASAYVRWRASQLPKPTVSGSANAGQGAGVTEPVITIEAEPDGMVEFHRWNASKGIIILLSGDGGGGTGSRTWTIEVPLEASFEGTIEEGADGFGGGVNVSAGTPVIDNRTVKLTRNSQDRFVSENGSMTTHGDTTYSFRAYDVRPTGGTDFGGNPQMMPGWKDENNSQTIGSALSGTWSPPFSRHNSASEPATSWSWTPATQQPADYTTDAGASQGSNFQIMPKGEHEKLYGDWRKGGGGGQDTVTVNCEVTDSSDGAAANAKYILHLHHEWENWRSDPDNARDMDEKSFPSGPAIGNVWAKCEPEETEAAQATFNSTIVTEIGASVGFNAGFTVADAVNFGVEGSVSWSKAYGSEFAATKNVNPGKHRYAYVQLNWYRYNYLVDHYTPGGRDANPARQDGAYRQSIDDLRPDKVSVTFDWSPEFRINDFDGDGQDD